MERTEPSSAELVTAIGEEITSCCIQATSSKNLIKLAVNRKLDSSFFY